MMKNFRDERTLVDGGSNCEGVKMLCVSLRASSVSVSQVFL